MEAPPIVPMVEKLSDCCGCASLETGSKIIGWLEMLGATVCGVLVIGANILRHVVLERLGKLGHEFPDTRVDTSVHVAYTVVTSALVVFIFSLAVCLLSGIYRKKPGLLQAWIAGSAVLQVIHVLVFILAFYYPLQVNLVTIVIGFVLKLYYMWVVYSYKLEILMGPADNQFTMNPKV